MISYIYSHPTARKLKLSALCKTLLIFVAYHISSGSSYIISPDPSFLSSISVVSMEHLFENDAIITIDALRNAAVPENFDNLIAITAADTFSGGLGAFLSRKVADRFNDKKIDTIGTKISTTGAYFGVRGLVRRGTRLLGLPLPLCAILGALAGSAVSEITKARGRKGFSGAALDDVDDSNNNNNSDRDLRYPEIGGDIAKWIIFDTFVEGLPIEAQTLSGLPHNTLYFALGSLSAAGGKIVKDALEAFADSKREEGAAAGCVENQGMADGSAVKTAEEANTPSETTLSRDTIVKYALSALEGGVLFSSYSISLWIAALIIPSNLDYHFPFDAFLDQLEGILKSDLT